jgi:(p)ppGpp synthase/HD superfamily hydrolase
MNIALLHDSIEDIEWMDYTILKKMFWEQVANWVKELSKLDWRDFIINDNYAKWFVRDLESGLSKKECKKNDRYVEIMKKAKEKRNEAYFGNLSELWECIFDVKCADRIHNLRTLEPMSTYQKVKKIIETKKYFMDEALKRKWELEKELDENWETLWEWRFFAYDLMQIEIDRRLMDPKISKEYNKQNEWIVR